MKREIITMKASGMPLEEIEAILASSTLQGFPVVKSPIDTTVVGYIRRAELRFAAGGCSFVEAVSGCATTDPAQRFLAPTDKAKRTHHLSGNSTCTFQISEIDSSHLHRHSESHMSAAHTARQAGEGDGWEWDAENELDDALAEEGRGEDDHADFGTYVDQVQPQLLQT